MDLLHRCDRVLACWLWSRRPVTAPLTPGLGFRGPEPVAPAVYRALLASFEARRGVAGYTSLERSDGDGYHNTHAMLPVLTTLPRETLAQLDGYLLPHVQRWAAVGPLALSAIWGVRTYRRNATLEPHVDRLSHALSVIIQISQVRFLVYSGPFWVYFSSTLGLFSALK